jgi:diacylglycerol O-acyltransferase
MGDTARLHALDLAWLEMEGDGPPIAIGTVAIAEGPAPTDDEVIALLAARLPRMPALHRVMDTSSLRRPSWHPAPGTPDLARHVHRIGAAGPTRDAAGRPDRGTRRWSGLDEAVSRIMETHLPGDRPLWDAWVVDGLPNGCWALVWRVHHTISDGVGAVFLLGHGFDLDPDGSGRTMADAAAEASRARQPRTGGATPRRSPLQRAADVLRGTAAHVAPALASLVPHAPSSLTAPVGDARRWVTVEIPLADVKSVGRAFGASVNDVVLAAVTGGFRDLLTARGDPVEGRIVRNLVPVSVRPPGEDGAGNHISALLCHLPVGLPDPAERLAAIHAAIDHGRGSHEPALASLLLGAVDLAVPAALQDAAVGTLGRTVPAWFFDTLTTNVPGPQYPVFVCGRQVLGMFPIIPVAGHTAITTGIFSYDGTLDVSVTGDGASAGDVGILADGMRREVVDLVATVSGSGGAT